MSTGVFHTAIFAPVPATIEEVLSVLDALLEPQRFQDYCVNGLQVPGAREISRIATGVSANAELFAMAAAEGADLLLVHHGLFWGSGVTSLDSVMAGRLRLLLEADIALAAYHLPLDAHPRLGNNALLARELEVTELEPFGLHRGTPIGVVGRVVGAGISAEDLAARVAAATSREPLLLSGAGDLVERVAVVSGAGADYVAEAAGAGAQALITGEAEERTMALAGECGVHVIAAGHHASETRGIRALGVHLAERFDVTHVFLEIPNPV
jgi:dinuclear metal center YbgI/SA1388 family protein